MKRIALILVLSLSPLYLAAQSNSQDTTKNTNQDQSQSQTPPNSTQPATQSNDAKPADATTPAKKADPLAFPEDISKAAAEKAQKEQRAEQGQLPDDPPLLKRTPNGTKPGAGAAAPKGAPAADNSTESSSKETKFIPIDDSPTHKSGGDDINELRPYDPHRAAKDVEVGNYYRDQKNYKGAIARYLDALAYKPGDVEATRHLGLCYETTKDWLMARDLYQKYLQDFPHGPFAGEAKERLEALDRKTSEK